MTLAFAETANVFVDERQHSIPFSLRRALHLRGEILHSLEVLIEKSHHTSVEPLVIPQVSKKPQHKFLPLSPVEGGLAQGSQFEEKWLLRAIANKFQEGTVLHTPSHFHVVKSKAACIDAAKDITSHFFLHAFSKLNHPHCVTTKSSLPREWQNPRT